LKSKISANSAIKEKNMAKKLTASSQQLKPDPVYNSKLVSKFINTLMWDGKKSVAQKVFYDAMDIISEKMKDIRSLDVFETAVNNVKPLLEVRSRRIGGASYQIPMQVRPARQQSLAFRWITQSARSKKGSAFCERLAAELIDAYNGHGGAMTTRENMHRMAEANKAFAHFAW
jgi:small subunit ribosomal protein S7